MEWGYVKVLSRNYLFRWLICEWTNRILLIWSTSASMWLTIHIVLNVADYSLFTISRTVFTSMLMKLCHGHSELKLRRGVFCIDYNVSFTLAKRAKYVMRGKGRRTLCARAIKSFIFSDVKGWGGNRERGEECTTVRIGPFDMSAILIFSLCGICIFSLKFALWYRRNCSCVSQNVYTSILVAWLPCVCSTHTALLPLFHDHTRDPVPVI